MTSSVVLGAPGIYREPDAPLHSLTGVRSDVAGFVGVAPRGPAREPASTSDRSHGTVPVPGAVSRSVPVMVESWEEYVDRFGGFDGPGLLPYAVHTFFREGGRRAYVVRIVHAYGDVRDEEGVAEAPLSGIFPRGLEGLPLRAAVPGEPGNGLTATLEWNVEALQVGGVRAGGIVVEREAEVVEGDLLRVEEDDGQRIFTRVVSVREEETPSGSVRVAAVSHRITTVPASVECVRGTLTVDGPAGGAPEVLEDLGLSPGHPRWLADVLTRESSFVRPDPRWSGAPLLPDGPDLAEPAAGRPFTGGRPGYPAVGRAPGARAVGDGLWLRTRSEGTWGNRLWAVLHLRTLPVELLEREPAALYVPHGAPTPQGALLRLVLEDGTTALRFVVDDEEVWHSEREGLRVHRLALDAPLPSPPRAATQLLGELEVFEEPGGRAGGGAIRRERHEGLGFSPDHPRWIARVLLEGSRLVRPHPEWEDVPLLRDGRIEEPGPFRSAPFAGGVDRYEAIAHEDFFDASWLPGEERSGDGVHALLDRDDLSLLVVPDLYSPGPLEPVEDVRPPPSLAGPRFAPCVSVAGAPDQATSQDALEGLRLDPRDDADLAAISALQRRLVEIADRQRSFIALLDVPPGLSPEAVLRWRSPFASAFAAAYHPWVRVSRASDGRGLVRLGPAAAAAGIVARQERAFGVQHGPGNAVAHSVTDVLDAVPPAHHDLLHPQGINVLLQERDGVRLTGGRTLSTDPAYRQMSVRRLVTLIARTLGREMQWAAFEPNGPGLRNRIRHLTTAFLRELHRANAFAAAAEEHAFFVRCDEALNPPRVVDAGRLLAEVGVAPAEPLEFVILRIAREADGTLQVRS